MTTDTPVCSSDLERGNGADEMLDAKLIELVHRRTLPVTAHLQECGLSASAGTGARLRASADELRPGT